MGQIVVPGAPPSIILSAVDRLVAVNADGGLSPTASHVILFGQNAGRNDAASEVIGIGWNALGGAGAGVSDLQLIGTIAIGADAAANLATIASGATGDALPSVVIGRDAARVTTQLSSSVVIGDKAMELYVPLAGFGPARDVVIGAGAQGNQAGRSNFENVVIGYNAARTSIGVPDVGLLGSVVIGSEAASGQGGNGVGSSSLTYGVVIGQQAALNVTASGGDFASVVIGAFAGTNLSARSVVLIGYSAQMTGAANNFNVLIGQNSRLSGQNSVVIGDSANVVGDRMTAIGASQTGGAGNNRGVQIGQGITGLSTARNILIGYGAGLNEPGANAERFLIETNDAGTLRAILYGDMNAGNLIAGNSIPGTNRDLNGTNTLKLLNGTNGANPLGGGYFLVLAGELLWHASAGASTRLTTPGFTVATLPAAIALGERNFVTNALAPAFGAIVAGGGAVTIPVFWNGVNWIVG